MRISIVLPFPVTKPVGGAKIMYEYANRLAEEGNKIVIYPVSYTHLLVKT